MAEVEDILKTFRDVGLFVAVNFIGCFIQAFIVYPSLYFFIVRKNPFTYLSGIVPAMITAFGTSSRYEILNDNFPAVHWSCTSPTLNENMNCGREFQQFDFRVLYLFWLTFGI